MLLGHERHRRRGHDVGDRRQLLRRGLGRGDERGDDLRASPAAPASRRRSCRARGAGSGTGSRRRSCRRRRGSPRTGPGALSASTCSSRPSAVTTSAASRSSMVRPCLRTRYPTPPPSVIPPIPTEPVSPNPVARPCAPAAAVYLAGGQSRLGPGCASVDVDLQCLHVREVEHDPALGHAVAGDAVAAAADGELQPGLAREAMTRETSPSSATRTMTAGRRSNPP